MPAPNTESLRVLELHKPSSPLVDSYLSMIEEMRKHGEKIWDSMIPAPGEPTAGFIERMLIAEDVPGPNHVRETTYWAALHGKVVGHISLRHELNAELSEFGGHIGYTVHPSFRRQGIATEMLKKLLLTPKAREIGRLLLTCAPDNVASNKTILCNGGVLAQTVFVEKHQRQTRHFWIDVSTGKNS